ncbi:hypothetical protein EDB89DRAFT_2065316 [Lactarius sanguifluus]|nr:hypothetical protein EDB89DRAFT_2065316 [Lactarius sanguifluus]
MYYDDEDEDPYAPRIGPAAMPSPRSKFAPYYLGHTNTFKDFLEEFEGLASNSPSLHDFWRSLSGYHSCDWPLFQQSLVNIFGNTTPQHQILRQKLHSYIQDSSRRRMFCKDDVLRYYRQFICFSLPLVHAGHLSEEECDTAFWYGFHSEDHKVLQPRLIGKNPFQPSDIPFHFEDVFFEPPIVRHEQPIIEPISRDAYGFQAVTCAIASNAETTTTPNELSPSSHPIQDTQLPSLSSPSALESQHGLVHSVMLDQPQPTYTLSTTLLPLASSPSHTSSPVHLATDNDLIPAYTFLITTSTLPPSVSPTLTHDSSLAHVAADVPKISSTPSPLITPAPLSMPMSDFEYLPLAMVDQPKPAPTLSSTPPSSSILSTFLPSPAHLATEDQSKPESTPTLFASIPTLTSTPTHIHLATDYGTTFAPTPPSSSTFLPSPVSMRSAMNSQPEPEPALLSVPLIPPSIDHIPEITSMPSSVLLMNFKCLPSEMVKPEYEPKHVPLSLSTLTSPSLSAPSLADDIRTLSSVPLPDISMLDSMPLILSPDQSSSSSGSLGHLSRPHELESSTPTSAADVVTLSHPELSLSSLDKTIPLLLAQHEASVTVPTPRHSTLSQRPPRIKTLGSESFPLKIALPIASSVPRRRCQEPSLHHEVPSIKQLPLAPHPSLFHSSGPLRRTPVRFNFTFVLITMAVLVSAFFNISATLFTHTRKFWSKIEDFGNNQNGNLKTSKSRNIPAHRLRLGQYTPRASHFVFNPGGPASSSSLKLLSAHEDARKCKPKTCSSFTILDTSSPIPIPTDNLTVFDPGVVEVVLESAHEDSVMLDEDAW